MIGPSCWGRSPQMRVTKLLHTRGPSRPAPAADAPGTASARVRRLDSSSPDPRPPSEASTLLAPDRHTRARALRPCPCPPRPSDGTGARVTRCGACRATRGAAACNITPQSPSDVSSRKQPPAEQRGWLRERTCEKHAATTWRRNSHTLPLRSSSHGRAHPSAMLSPRVSLEARTAEGCADSGVGRGWRGKQVLRLLLPCLLLTFVDKASGVAWSAVLTLEAHQVGQARGARERRPQSAPNPKCL